VVTALEGSFLLSSLLLFALDILATKQREGRRRKRKRKRKGPCWIQFFFLLYPQTLMKERERLVFLVLAFSLFLFLFFSFSIVTDCSSRLPSPFSDQEKLKTSSLIRFSCLERSTTLRR